MAWNACHCIVLLVMDIWIPLVIVLPASVYLQCIPNWLHGLCMLILGTGALLWVAVAIAMSSIIAMMLVIVLVCRMDGDS